MPSGGTSKTVSTQELSKEQKQLLSYVLPMAKDYASKPLEMYPGSAIVGPNQTQLDARASIAGANTNLVDPLSQTSINTAKNLTGYGANQGLQGADTLMRLGDTGTAGVNLMLGDYLSGMQGRNFLQNGALLDPNSNPNLQAQTEAAMRPLTANLTQKVLPGIRSDFVGNNMFGSSRQGIAEGNAIQDYLGTAGDVSANIQANNFTQGLNAMTQMLAGGRSAGSSATGEALGAGQAGSGQFLNAALQGLSLSPGLAQLAYLPGMTMEGLGAMTQAEDQAKLSELADRFTTQQMLPIMQAQDIANLAFGFPGGPATSTASQQSNPMSSILGLLMLPFLGI